MLSLTLLCDVDKGLASSRSRERRISRVADRSCFSSLSFSSCCCSRHVWSPYAGSAEMLARIVVISFSKYSRRFVASLDFVSLSTLHEAASLSNLVNIFDTVSSCASRISCSTARRVSSSTSSRMESWCSLNSSVSVWRRAVIRRTSSIVTEVCLSLSRRPIRVLRRVTRPRAEPLFLRYEETVAMANARVLEEI